MNFPAWLNPGLARALGVMLKLDFQRAVLSRIARIAEPTKTWRDVLFVCDEYHAFATTGDTDPSGDERTIALSRQARLIPIVATQSISSLRSAVHGEESWRTLLQWSQSQAPTYCYLKPHYLDVQTSYFDHVARGVL